MDRNQLCIHIGKQWRDIGEKLARNVLSGGRPRRGGAKSGIVFIQKLVVEALVHDLAGAAFNFADVDEHAGDWIDPATENKVGDVVEAGAVLGATFIAECSDIFALAPA